MKSIGKFNRLLNVLGEGGGVRLEGSQHWLEEQLNFWKREGGLTVVKDFTVYCFNNDRF